MTDELEDLKMQVEALRRKINDRTDGLGRYEDHDSVADVLAEIDALDARLGNIEDRITRIERVVDTNPESVEYSDMGKAEKVYQIRQQLVEIAKNTDGTASMDYSDVRMLFSGQASAGHCYNLMEAAGHGLDGFTYDNAGGRLDADAGQKRIRVKLDDVNDLAAFHRVNNGEQRTPGVNDA
jgi:hypothetical protein